MEAQERMKYATKADGLMALLIAVKDSVSFQGTWGRDMAQVQQSSKWLPLFCILAAKHTYTYTWLTYKHIYRFENKK